jgi:hypothetical protein
MKCDLPDVKPLDDNSTQTQSRDIRARCLPCHRIISSRSVSLFMISLPLNFEGNFLPQQNPGATHKISDRHRSRGSSSSTAVFLNPAAAAKRHHAKGLNGSPLDTLFVCRFYCRCHVHSVVKVHVYPATCRAVRLHLHLRSSRNIPTLAGGFPHMACWRRREGGQSR